MNIDMVCLSFGGGVGPWQDRSRVQASVPYPFRCFSLAWPPVGEGTSRHPSWPPVTKRSARSVISTSPSSSVTDQVRVSLPSPCRSSLVDGLGVVITLAEPWISIVCSPDSAVMDLAGSLRTSCRTEVIFREHRHTGASCGEWIDLASGVTYHDSLQPGALLNVYQPIRRWNADGSNLFRFTPCARCQAALSDWISPA